MKKSSFRLLGVLAAGLLVAFMAGSTFSASLLVMPFTPPDTEQAHNPFSFIVYGDVQNVYKDGHRRLVAQMEQENAAFIVNTGDMSPDGGANYDRYFYPEICKITERVSFFPVSGNHDISWLSERSRYPYRNFFSKAYDYLAGQPYNSHISAPQSQRLWYGFRYAAALFLVLDSNLMIDTGRYGKTNSLAPYRDYAEEQLKWVRDILETTSKDSTIKTMYVFFHHSPFYSKKNGSVLGLFGGHEDDREMMLSEGIHAGEGRVIYLFDLFRRYGVNAVFSGHQHYYERWREVIEEHGQPIHTLDWVITGSGGVKPRSHDGYGDRRVEELLKEGGVYDRYLNRVSAINANWTAHMQRVYPNKDNRSGEMQSYTLVTVNGGEVHFRTRDVDGTIRDAGFLSH